MGLQILPSCSMARRVIEAAGPTLYRSPQPLESPMRLAVALLLALAAAPASAATGQDVFNDKCAECHTVDPPSGTAPALKGVVGRKVASLSDFQYSDALKAKGGAWTEAALDAFIANPKAYAPGTQMTAGDADPADRKAIIDYLKSAP